MTLRSKLIRLAHQNPELRSELLPLLKQATTKQAASEISLEELPIAQKELVAIVEYPIVQVWEGIHGYIVEFKGNSPGGARIDRNKLKRMLGHKDFRWISPSDRDGFSVGM